MKKLAFIAAAVLLTTHVFAQSVDLRRKIEVSGIAEKEVTPDIIDVSISLQEYMDGKTKVELSQLENQLETAVKDAGIPKEDFTVNNVSAYNYQIQKKRNPGLLAAKQYTIRFHDLDKYNRIINSVDPKGISSTNVDNLDYSKKVELKKQLLIDALLAAKTKAEFLANSVGEKLGRVIDINETENSNVPVMYEKSFVARFSNTTSADNTPDSDIGIKKIKISFQVNAVFEIAN
jgi:uncharacterized protein YggE